MSSYQSFSKPLQFKFKSGKQSCIISYKSCSFIFFRLGQQYVTGVQGGFCGSLIILVSNYTHAELIHLPFSSIYCMTELPRNDPSSPPFITAWFSRTVHAIPERQDLRAYFVGSMSIDRSLLFYILVGSPSCNCMVKGKRETRMRCFRVKYGG